MVSNFPGQALLHLDFVGLEHFLLMNSSVLFTGINKVSALGSLGKKCRVGRTLVSMSKLMVFSDLILLSLCFNTEAY